MTSIISSQDFRNLYEKFYNRMRNYLWPIDTLRLLADVEVDIYSAFINYEELRNHLDKLYNQIRATMEDDEFLTKAYNQLVDLLNEIDPDKTKNYLAIYRVNETDPELEKQIRLTPVEEEEKNNENN